MGKKGFYLIDNNALGFLLQRYPQFLKVRDGIFRDTGFNVLETVVVPGTFLEAIGVELPDAPSNIAPTPEHIAEVFASFERYKQDIPDSGFYTALFNIREDLHEKYKTWLSALPDLSLGNLATQFDEKLRRLPNESKAFFSETFEKCFRLEKDRMHLISRLASDFTFGYRLDRLKTMDRRFVQLVHAFYLLDLPSYHQDQYNFSFSRQVNATWFSFVRMILKDLRKDGRSLSVDRSTLAKNHLVVEKMLSLKRQGRDLVDMEIIHHACVGKHRDGVIYPVVCVTADSIVAKTRYRIALYKSIVNHAFDMARAAPGRRGDYPLDPEPGWILVVNQTGNVIHQSRVAQIPMLLNKFGSMELSADTYP